MKGKFVMLERNAANILLGITPTEKGLAELKELSANNDDEVRLSVRSLDNLMRTMTKYYEDMNKKDKSPVNVTPLLDSTLHTLKETAEHVLSLLKQVENLSIIFEWISLSQWHAMDDLMMRRDWSFEFLMDNLDDEHHRCEIHEDTKIGTYGNSRITSWFLRNWIVEYLKSIDFPADEKVYVISESGLQRELEQAGIPRLGGPEHDNEKVDLSIGNFVEHDHDVGAVVVGFDQHLNYYKIQYATLCIRENPGCLFIAANCDDAVQLKGGKEWAGEGAAVGAIIGSTRREPIVAGKPSTFMMEYLAEKFKITKTQICMVGDKLDTDILFGQNGGCKTLLVLSGVTDLKALLNPDNTIQPDYHTHQVSDLLAAELAVR